MSLLPKLKVERKTQGGEGSRDDPKADHDLRLAPAQPLEVMVDGRHQKDAPTRRLEAHDLNDDRECLADEETAHDQRDELRFGEHSQGCERPAQGERAGVPHEDRRGVAVVPEEAYTRTRDGRSKDGKVLGTDTEGDHAHSKHYNKRAAPRKTVKSIREVNGIGQARHEQEHEDEVDPGDVNPCPAHLDDRGEHAQIERESPGEVDPRGDVADVDRRQAECDRNRNETRHLLGGREAQRALVGNRLDVIEEAERPRREHREHREDEFCRPARLQRAGDDDT